MNNTIVMVQQGRKVFPNHTAAFLAIMDFINSSYEGHQFDVIIAATSMGEFFPVVKLDEITKGFEHDFKQAGFKTV